MKELNEKELLLLAYLEGELNSDEKAKAEAMMAEDAALQHEYRQLKNTVVRPETATVYPNKNKLKRAVAKEKTPLAYILWPLSIAASLALLLLLYSPKSPATTGESGVAAATNTGVANHNTELEKETKSATPASNNQQVVSNTPANNTHTNNAKSIKPSNAAAATHSSPTNTTHKSLTLNAPLLAVQPLSVPQVNLPEPNITAQQNIALPAMPRYEEPEPEEKKGWWAKTGNKINHLLGYIQKPRLSIEKEENETGKEYWAIILEAEKYEVEGRLYTHR